MCRIIQLDWHEENPSRLLELPHLGYLTIRFDYDYGTYDSSIIAIITITIRFDYCYLDFSIMAIFYAFFHPRWISSSSDVTVLE